MLPTGLVDYDWRHWGIDGELVDRRSKEEWSESGQ